jgi:hypothetical protein
MRCQRYGSDERGCEERRESAPHPAWGVTPCGPDHAARSGARAADADHPSVATLGMTLEDGASEGGAGVGLLAVGHAHSPRYETRTGVPALRPFRQE